MPFLSPSLHIFRILTKVFSAVTAKLHALFTQHCSRHIFTSHCSHTFASHCSDRVSSQCWLIDFFHPLSVYVFSCNKLLRVDVYLQWTTRLPTAFSVTWSLDYEQTRYVHVPVCNKRPAVPTQGKIKAEVAQVSRGS